MSNLIYTNALIEVTEILEKLKNNLKLKGFDIGTIDSSLQNCGNIFALGQDFIDYWSLRLGELFVDKLTFQCNGLVINAHWRKHPFTGCKRYYVDVDGLLIDPKALLIMESSSNIQDKQGTFDAIFFNFIYIHKYSLYSYINPIIDITEISEEDYLLRWNKYPPKFICKTIRELDDKGTEWQRHLSLNTYDWFSKGDWDKIDAHLLQILQ